jgi:GMP synthase (glutamine-hydrolysing)
MSHGDKITKKTKEMQSTATSFGSLNAFEVLSKRLYGLQFHPEVAHTLLGLQILQNFVFKVCQCHGYWSPGAIISEQISLIQSRVGQSENVICGLSGGVDSTVAAVLTHQAIGERQICIFVDNGLLRGGEYEAILEVFKRRMSLNVKGVSASSLFFNSLDGVTDPELKRKKIGQAFIEVFDEEAKKRDGAKHITVICNGA